MVDRGQAVAIGVSAGVVGTVLAAACVLLAIWMYRRRASVTARTRSVESSSATLRADGSHCASLDSSVSVSVVSESVAYWGHPPPAKRAAFWAWRGGAGHNGREPPPLTVSGIPKYHYKYDKSFSIFYLRVHMLPWTWSNTSVWNMGVFQSLTLIKMFPMTFLQKITAIQMGLLSCH